MSGYFLQGRHGTKGNFEAVVPLTHGTGLSHLWRNNDNAAFPWIGPTCFGSGDVASACLIQSNFGTPGNLEVVARAGDGLDFYWRIDRAPWTWSGGGRIFTGARGNPALIQSRHGTKGNFEVVVPHRDGGLVHLWRNNDIPSMPWSGPSRFGSGTVDGVSFIQGNFGSPGNLELVAVEAGRLQFYWRLDRAPWTWGGPFTIASAVRGVPSLIQSRHGVKGNFEVVVPHRDGGLVHLWRNNDIPSMPWSGPSRFGVGVYDEVTCVQGNFGSPGNLEVLARRSDGALHFYWRMDRSPWAWSGPFLVGSERAFDVSECVYGWRAAYLQSDTHVVVRIQVNPDAGISAATMDTLRTTWRNAIIGKWGNRFDCRAPNGERRRITFDVHWVGSNAHHVVRVRPGPARSNMTTWDTSDTGDVASHEFGHMLGHPDEYADAACPARSPVSTGTVMDDNTEVVERLVERVASFHCGHDATPISPLQRFDQGVRLDEGRLMRAFEELSTADRAHFAERLRAAPSAAERGEPPRTVVMIGGGAPGQRYEYRAEVQADGRANVHLVDEMAGRSERKADVPVDAGAVALLFQRASSEEVLDAEGAIPRFVPDSLVGTIVITDGETEKRLLFAVDEEGVTQRAPNSEDVRLAIAPGLLIRQEFASAAVREVLGALQAIPGLAV